MFWCAWRGVGFDGYSLYNVASGYTSLSGHFLGDGRFLRGARRREVCFGIYKSTEDPYFKDIQHVVEIFLPRDFDKRAGQEKHLLSRSVDLSWDG